MTGPREEFVTVGGGHMRMRVLVAGEGPPLVFLHPLSGLAWQPLLDRLATRHTVYAPELPGTTPGDPDAIREVHTSGELLLVYEEALRRLGLDRPALLGESFGGMLAADLAATFPALPGRLVLMAPIGFWRDDAPIPLVEMLAGAPEDLPRYLFAHPESAAARAVLSLPDDPELIPRAVAQNVWNIGCASRFTWPIADHGLRRRLHRISAPTLIVWGTDDALVPAAYAAEFGRGISDSRVELIDDCGHVIEADQPERLWAILDGFLAGADAPGTGRGPDGGPAR